jgi:hypothetical protein
MVLTLTPQSDTKKVDAVAPRAHAGASIWPPGLQLWPQSVELQATAVSEGPPTYQVTPATTSNEAIIREAVDRFTAAGLDLPSLQIVFSDDERACNGHLGLFESSQQPWRVAICSDLAFVPVHELAHAWIKSNIDQPTRDLYLQVRNKTGWNSPDLDWNERGVEDAAFVIQQNLTANHTGELDDEWNSRATAYEFLTGTTSPLRKQPPGGPHSTATSQHRQQDTTWGANTAPSPRSSARPRIGAPPPANRPNRAGWLPPDSAWQETDRPAQLPASRVRRMLHIGPTSRAQDAAADN